LREKDMGRIFSLIFVLSLLFGVAAFLATPGYPGKSTAGYIEAQSRRAFGVTLRLQVEAFEVEYRG